MEIDQDFLHELLPLRDVLVRQDDALQHLALAFE